LVSVFFLPCLSWRFLVVPVPSEHILRIIHICSNSIILQKTKQICNSEQYSFSFTRYYSYFLIEKVTPVIIVRIGAQIYLVCFLVQISNHGTQNLMVWISSLSHIFVHEEVVELNPKGNSAKSLVLWLAQQVEIWKNFNCWNDFLSTTRYIILLSKFIKEFMLWPCRSLSISLHRCKVCMKEALRYIQSWKILSTH